MKELRFNDISVLKLDTLKAHHKEDSLEFYDAFDRYYGILINTFNTVNYALYNNINIDRTLRARIKECMENNQALELDYGDGYRRIDIKNPSEKDRYDVIICLAELSCEIRKQRLMMQELREVKWDYVDHLTKDIEVIPAFDQDEVYLNVLVDINLNGSWYGIDLDLKEGFTSDTLESVDHCGIEDKRRLDYFLDSYNDNNNPKNAFFVKNVPQNIFISDLIDFLAGGFIEAYKEKYGEDAFFEELDIGYEDLSEDPESAPVLDLFSTKINDDSENLN